MRTVYIEQGSMLTWIYYRRTIDQGSILTGIYHRGTIDQESFRKREVAKRNKIFFDL